jgi:hypothetical protein
MIFRWFQLPVLLLVSHLSLHSTCPVFLSYGLYILESSQLLSFTPILSPEISISIYVHVSFSLSRIMMSGLLFWMVIVIICCHLYLKHLQL